MKKQIFQASHTSASRAFGGFTLVELMVVISIISLLIAVLLPALGKARQTAAQIQCLANLRGNTQAYLVYAGDYKGSLPAWVGSDSTFVGNKKHYENRIGNPSVWAYDPVNVPIYSASSMFPSGNLAIGPGIVILRGYANANAFFCPGRGATDIVGAVTNLKNGQVNVSGNSMSSYLFANCQLDGQITQGAAPVYPFSELFNRWHNANNTEGGKLLAIDVFYADWNNLTDGFDANGHDFGYNLTKFDGSGGFYKDQADYLQQNFSYSGATSTITSIRTGQSYISTGAAVMSNPFYRFDGSAPSRRNSEYWIQTQWLGWTKDKCQLAEPRFADTYPGDPYPW